MAWYDYPITRGFLWTPEHVTWHSGIDLGAPWNTAVTAALSGQVVFAQCKPWGGQVDILVNWQDSSDTQPHSYVVTVLHLHRILVSVGQSVTRGQVIGYSGGDGRGPCPTQMPKYSDGPHVHFELTLGTLGPYHGGPPYKFGRNAHTVSPAFLLAFLRGQISREPPAPPDPGGASSQQDSLLLPDLTALFAQPAAITTLLASLPGFEDIIYRLHDAETFPGWKTIDEIAPVSGVSDINVNTPGVTVRIPLRIIESLSPGRMTYWIIGNLFGNLQAACVRLVFVIVGMTLLLALLIALAGAQVEEDVSQATEAIKTVAPLVEGAA